MQKFLIEVYIPAANQKYDVFLPGHVMLNDAIKMIVKAAADISGGLFQGDEETVLCSRANGAILNINMSVDELQLCNGSQLILV